MNFLTRWIRRGQYALARWYLYRKLDKIGMPRSESARLVEYVLDSKFPTQ